jgi:hypothetical protein
VKPREARRHLRVLREGTTIWRVYPAGGPHPVAWDAFRDQGPTVARFDHHLPDGRDRAILYAAVDGSPAVTALAEAFPATVVDRAATAPRWVAFALTRDVTVLDVPRSAEALWKGPRTSCRRWSRQIWEALPEVEGLVYPSAARDNGDRNVALYERARDAVPDAPTFDRALGDPALLAAVARACRAVGYALL